jgi:hypothetical protein
MKYEYEIVNTHTSTVNNVAGVITKIDYIFKVFNGDSLLKNTAGSVDLSSPMDDFIKLDDIGHADLVRFIQSAEASLADVG